MSDKPSMTQMVQEMIEAAANAKTVKDLPLPGTFATKFGEGVREDLTAENVEAFMHGTGIINLLVQESILRVVATANETQAKAETKDEVAYTEGCRDGALLIAQIMSLTADSLVRSMIEGPAIEREFNQIVRNF